ncbi:MAG TPA: glycerophosphodiester phosphodiesterase [Actinomycetota bacterium]|jgi:glycerophosphoryl diester phosphodiesterase|nr:glycerophosphodiester phosphodiesterase [Actinomycetota bacterium]
MADRSWQDAGLPVVVAHRGASSTHPENTRSAFEAAIALGARLVETDVRLTADGEPVLIHDPEVSRTTDGSGWVHQLATTELRSMNAGTQVRPEPVPTLREGLELVSGRAGIALEIKNLPGEPAFEAGGEAIVEAAAATLEAVRFPGPVLVLSFNPRSIGEARRLLPGAATGFLITDATAPDAGLAHVVDAGHDLLLPGRRGLAGAGPGFVKRAHGQGVRVGTWTVDDPEDVRRFLDWGVDAVASNDPAMALGVLEAWRAG